MKLNNLNKKIRIILITISVGITIISFIVRAINDNDKDSMIAYMLLSVLVVIVAIIAILQVVNHQPSNK